MGNKRDRNMSSMACGTHSDCQVTESVQDLAEKRNDPVNLGIGNAPAKP